MYEWIYSLTIVGLADELSRLLVINLDENLMISKERNGRLANRTGVKS